MSLVTSTPTKKEAKPLRDPLNRAFYLPRLPREYYQADAVVHWTLTIFDRKQGWLTPELHHQFRELMFHAAAREGLVCPIYCLMPDHLHLVWMGLRLDTDQLNAVLSIRLGQSHPNHVAKPSGRADPVTNDTRQPPHGWSHRRPTPSRRGQGCGRGPPAARSPCRSGAGLGAKARPLRHFQLRRAAEESPASAARKAARQIRSRRRGSTTAGVTALLRWN